MFKEKVCKECGKVFLPVNGTQQYCKGPHSTHCQVCGKEIEYTQSPKENPKCCSTQCREQMKKQNLMKKYGVSNVSHLQSVRDKISKSNSSPEVVSKRKQTCMDRYGVDNVSKCAMLHTYTKHPDSILSRLSRPYLQLDVFNTLLSVLKEHDILYESSVQISGEVFSAHVENTPILLDVCSTHVANTQNPRMNACKSKLAYDNGYRCIHVFDWDNMDKLIDNLLICSNVVYARKCSIYTISAKTACEFEDKYHLQSSCRGQKVCLGLFFQDELIQVMTFGKPRYHSRYEWELLRLCSKSGYRVVGGACKLYHHFIKQYNPSSIISYCDRAKFSGDSYMQLGMKLDHTTEPAKVWSRHTSRITDNLLRQRGYDQLFGTTHGKGTSNEALMIEDGWLPVYDCGQAVYTWIR